MDQQLIKNAETLADRLSEDDAKVVNGLLAAIKNSTYFNLKNWNSDDRELGGAKVAVKITKDDVYFTIEMVDDAGNNSSVYIECDNGLATIRGYMPTLDKSSGPSDLPVFGVAFGSDKTAIYVGEKHDRIFSLMARDPNIAPFVNHVIIEDNGIPRRDAGDSFSDMRLNINVPSISNAEDHDERHVEYHDDTNDVSR